MRPLTAEPFPTHRRARWVLAAFVVTFLVARVLVLLIMTRRLPDLFLHVGQTLFVSLLVERVNRFGMTMGPWLESIERTGPR